MDIEEIRNLVRQSIRDQVNKLVEERLSPPASFEKFNILVREALENTNDNLSHEEVYGMWSNISSEISGIRDAREAVSEWNASLSYYTRLLEVSKDAKTILFERLKR